jgi:ATP-dependent DNA helicase RecG
MISACRQAGLPEPELEEIGSGFRVTLRRERTREPQIAPVDAAIREILRDSPEASTRQIAEKVRRTPRAVRTRLARLVQAGQIVVVGSSAKDPHRGYHLKTGH